MSAYNNQPPLKLLSAVAVWEIFKFRAEESIVYILWSVEIKIHVSIQRGSGTGG